MRGLGVLVRLCEGSDLLAPPQLSDVEFQFLFLEFLLLLVLFLQ
jgi:hypothetical protein